MSEEILDKILTKVETSGEQLDRLTTKVIDMDARLDSFVTKEDFHGRMDRMADNIDRFVKLHETLDHELVAMRSKYERLEERLEKVELQLASS